MKHRKPQERSLGGLPVYIPLSSYKTGCNLGKDIRVLLVYIPLSSDETYNYGFTAKLIACQSNTLHTYSAIEVHRFLKGT